MALAQDVEEVEGWNKQSQNEATTSAGKQGTQSAVAKAGVVWFPQDPGRNQPPLEPPS